MNFNNNNQDALSFLSVPSDGMDQSFSSLLSPQRSSSPSSLLSDQLLSQQAQSQSNSGSSNLGSFRTRARAGTLPSRFNSNTLAPSQQATSASSASAISPSFSPSDPNSLNLEAFSISHPSTSMTNTFTNTNNINNTNSSSSGTNRPRLRSGSLLGLSESNSIWSNNDQQSNHQTTTQVSALASVNFMPDGSVGSPIRDFPGSTAASILSLSPTKSHFQTQSAQQHQYLDDNITKADINRARAYSTNNALLNEPSNYYLQNYLTLEEEKIVHHQQHHQQQHQQQQQFTQSEQQFINDFANRPRAQTFQNGVEPIQYNLTSNSIFETPEYEENRSSSTSTQVHAPQHSFLKDQPLLIDDVDPRFLNWTSTYQDPSLGPTNTLFLSNLPPQAISPLPLANLLIKFGKITSVRILKGNENAIVELDSVDSAMQAKAQLNHQELMPGFTCLVGFAKLLPSHPQPTVVINDEKPQASQQQHNQQPTQTQVPPQIHVQSQPDEPTYVPPATISEHPNKLIEMVPDINDAVTKLGCQSVSGTIKSIINHALDYKGVDNDFGPLPEPLPTREYDAPKLRETRKLIEANSLSQFDIEELSIAMLDELPELASDYLGNTIVQKLFEFSSEPIKYIMLKEVAPFLAQMGIHKNGTWSAQKMITVADTPIQKAIVANSLKPYCVPLFNDQFGNYVIQCSLKFGSPWNDFIFEVILAKFWDIAQNRFGARAVRACLESHEASSEQTALISAAIILHAEHLAINQNAALLITWFLDTCTLPNRHALLAPRLIPHLAQLCTHKLASLTVLKILNHRGEADAKNMIMNAIFGPVYPVSESENGNGSTGSLQDGNSAEIPRPPETLEQILHDNVHGATFIFKVISNPLIEPEVRQHVVSQVRRVLLELNVSSYQGYKRLMDEVGLTNRADGNRHSRSHSNGTSNGRKGRQNKSSPQNFNNRRSTPNGFRNQPHQTLISPPQPSSFMSTNQIYYEDQQYQQQSNPPQQMMNDYYQQPYLTPQQQIKPQSIQGNGYYAGENVGVFNNGGQYSGQTRAAVSQQHMSGFEDPYNMNQYNNISNDRSIYQQQQPQYGYGSAQF